MNHSAILSETDKKLLNLIQTDFPLVTEPYKHMADTVGVSEEEVINRINDLKSNGIIRRIGPVFDAKSLGYTSALFAVKVPEDKEEKAAKYISSFEGVTHNYHRDHEYNIWFTLVAEGKEAMNGIIDAIKNKISPQKFLQLRAKRTFKIRGVFEFGSTENRRQRARK